jgi:putative transposase
MEQIGPAIPEETEAPARGVEPPPAASDDPPQSGLGLRDFFLDRATNGQQLKCLTVIDEQTPECLSILVDGQIHSRRVVEELTRLVSLHGAPRHIRSDNGPEFVSTAVIRWVIENEIGMIFITPGKPRQNGREDRFNGKSRRVPPNLEWFRARAKAGAAVKIWCRGYIHERPHTIFSYLTPSESIDHLLKAASDWAFFK